MPDGTTESAASRYAREWGNHSTSQAQAGGGGGGDNRKDRGLDAQGGTHNADNTYTANTRTNALFVTDGSTNVNINN